MTRYEIKKNYAEIKKMEDVAPGCTLDQIDQDPETVASKRGALTHLFNF